jgi:hypothetical protein
VLKTKRELPPVMCDADKLVEQWRYYLLASIHLQLHVSTYLLVVATCRSIGDKTKQLMPHNMSKLHMFVRGQLFALQFALSALKGELPSGKFAHDIISGSLNMGNVQLANQILDQMYVYSVVRDCYLTYSWGGYEVENPTKNTLRFVDHPNWMGRRDHAQLIISQEIEQELAQSAVHSLIIPPRLMLEYSVDVFPTLSVDGLTATQFVSAWGCCIESFGQHCLAGETISLGKDTLVAMLQARAGLSNSEAARFVDLVTFDGRESSALSLFHCPLIPVTVSSLLVLPPGFVFGNPSVCIPRLAVHKGAGINTYSKEIEKYLLGRLKHHFSADGVTIETSVPYSSQSDKGDIDLIIYESITNRLLVAMAKVFIVPDTVEEVVRANEKLEEGLQQTVRVQQWLKNLNNKSWAKALKIPVLSGLPKIQFAVIGNGFAGSDYLSIPQDIAMVDARYLLLPKFAGQSVFDAIDAYQRRLSEEGSKAIQSLHYRSVRLGDLIFEVPSF